MNTMYIIGDSQAEALAIAAKKELAAGNLVNINKKFKGVTRIVQITKSGANSKEVAKLFNQFIKNNFPFFVDSTDMAILACGGNDTGAVTKLADKDTGEVFNVPGLPVDYENLVYGLLRAFPENALTVLVPPRATVIGDLAKAKKVFGDKVTSEFYWIDSGYAAKRDEVIQVYDNILHNSELLNMPVRNILKLRRAGETSPKSGPPRAEDARHAPRADAADLPTDGIHLTAKDVLDVLSLAWSGGGGAFPLVICLVLGYLLLKR